jgi:hypothetical protein
MAISQAMNTQVSTIQRRLKSDAAFRAAAVTRIASSNGRPDEATCRAIVASKDADSIAKIAPKLNFDLLLRQQAMSAI